MKKNQIKVRRIQTGSETIFTIKNEDVYNITGKRRVYCGCTGNTEETATPMKYNGEKIYCPNCHEHKVEILETYSDYLARLEDENRKKLENLKVVCVGQDWECGLKFYSLSAKLEYDDWLLVKQYFSYKRKGWSRNQELEWYCFEPTGWLTRNGKTVQKILFNAGLIKEENLREFEEWEC